MFDWRSAILLVTAVCSATVHAAEPDPKSSPDLLRVMTFNIRFNNPNDGPDAWPERRHDVAEFIRASDLDVFGLQEALRDQIADLEERLPEFAWHGVGRDDGAEKGEFVPIFVRRERFEVLEQGTFWLSESPEMPGSKSWDSSLPRITTRLRLKDRNANRTFVVYNTHFDHRGRQARLESAKLLVARITAEADGEPVILTGDFNTRADSEPYRALIDGGLYDSREKSTTPARGPDSTWNGFREIAPGRRIEFLFFHGPIEARANVTVDRRRAGERFLSDHLPVIADFALTP